MHVCVRRPCFRDHATTYKIFPGKHSWDRNTLQRTGTLQKFGGSNFKPLARYNIVFLIVQEISLFCPDNEVMISAWIMNDEGRDSERHLSGLFLAGTGASL